MKSIVLVVGLFDHELLLLLSSVQQQCNGHISCPFFVDRRTIVDLNKQYHTLEMSILFLLKNSALSFE